MFFINHLHPMTNFNLFIFHLFKTVGALSILWKTIFPFLLLFIPTLLFLMWWLGTLKFNVFTGNLSRLNIDTFSLSILLTGALLGWVSYLFQMVKEASETLAADSLDSSDGSFLYISLGQKGWMPQALNPKIKFSQFSVSHSSFKSLGNSSFGVVEFDRFFNFQFFKNFRHFRFIGP